MAVSGWLRKKGDVFGGSDICCLTGCPEGFQPYTVLACRVVAWMVRLMTGLPFWYSFPDFFWWSGGWHCTAASWELWRAKFWVWQYCWPICMKCIQLPYLYVVLEFRSQCSSSQFFSIMISIGEVYVVIPLLRREGRAGTSGAFGASFAAVFLRRSIAMRSYHQQLSGRYLLRACYWIVLCATVPSVGLYRDVLSR